MEKQTCKYGAPIYDEEESFTEEAPQTKKSGILPKVEVAIAALPFLKKWKNKRSNTPIYEEETLTQKQGIPKATRERRVKKTTQLKKKSIPSRLLRAAVLGLAPTPFLAGAAFAGRMWKRKQNVPQEEQYEEIRERPVLQKKRAVRKHQETVVTEEKTNHGLIVAPLAAIPLLIASGLLWKICKSRKNRKIKHKKVVVAQTTPLPPPTKVTSVTQTKIEVPQKSRVQHKYIRPQKAKIGIVGKPRQVAVVKPAYASPIIQRKVVIEKPQLVRTEYN